MTRRFKYDKETDSIIEVGIQPRGTNDWKPLHCEALAFDGNTVDEAKLLDKALGAPDVNYDANNCPILNDKSTYNRYLKAHGYVNKTSGKGHHHLSKELLDRAIKRAAE